MRVFFPHQQILRLSGYQRCPMIPESAETAQSEGSVPQDCPPSATKDASHSPQAVTGASGRPAADQRLRRPPWVLLLERLPELWETRNVHQFITRCDPRSESTEGPHRARSGEGARSFYALPRPATLRTLVGSPAWELWNPVLLGIVWGLLRTESSSPPGT